MDKKNIPLWKFNKVKITQIHPYITTSNERSHDKCYASIDFGFFMVHDIGISIHNKVDLSWSNDFGWSRFKFNDSHINNPYGEEVRKLEMMIKNELDSKKDDILEYIKGDENISKYFKNN